MEGGIFGDIHVALPAPWAEMALVALSVVCGALVGWERERRQKAAGLRTMMLICFGSAVFTMVGMSPALGRSDPGRIAAQIVTGVGFLGAGAILRERGGVVGLTTAATIWATAAVGMVIGAGYAGAGLALAVAVPLALSALLRFEQRSAGCDFVPVRLVYRPEEGKTRVRIQATLDGHRAPFQVRSETAPAGAPGELVLLFCRSHKEHRALVAELAEVPGVERLETEGAARGA